MKAIQIKYLPFTTTKPSRLKVWAEGVNPKFYSIESFDTNSNESSELQAAKKFASDLNWLDKNDLAIGQLPNGDHAAVFIEKPLKGK